MTPVSCSSEKLSGDPRMRGYARAPSRPDAPFGHAPAPGAGPLSELMTLLDPAERETFLSCLVSDLTAAAAGLARTLAQDDDRGARHWSHALIGLGGTVGANHLHDLARSLHGDLTERRAEAARRHLPEIRAEINRLVRFCRDAAAREAVA